MYDQPNLFQSQYSDSDHEAERASSMSPPPVNEEVYSEAIIPNGENLVRPSFLRSKRTVYPGKYLESYID